MMHSRLKVGDQCPRVVGRLRALRLQSVARGHYLLEGDRQLTRELRVARRCRPVVLVVQPSLHETDPLLRSPTRTAPTRSGAFPLGRLIKMEGEGRAACRNDWATAGYLSDSLLCPPNARVDGQ